MRFRMDSQATSRAILAAAVLAALACGCAGITPHLPGGGDNADYIAEAESLVTHGRRLQLHLYGTPEASLRPPLMSVLLAGVVKLFGRNVAAMKGLMVLCAAAAVLAAWWALREGLWSVESGAREGLWSVERGEKQQRALQTKQPTHNRKLPLPSKGRGLGG